MVTTNFETAKLASTKQFYWTCNMVWNQLGQLGLLITQQHQTEK